MISSDTKIEKSIQATLLRHGALIRNALETRFQTQTIVTLEQHVASKSNEMTRVTDGGSSLFRITQLILNAFFRVVMGNDKKRNREGDKTLKVIDDQLNARKRQRV